MWRREGGGRKGEWGGEGVRREISEAEMRIQKRGHHSDSHLLSFSSSHTCMHARAPARTPICAEAFLNISAPIKGDVSVMSGCFLVVIFLSISLSPSLSLFGSLYLSLFPSLFLLSPRDWFFFWFFFCR